MFFRSSPRFVHEGRTYYFAFKSSYMGEVDYIITDETGTYRAHHRHGLGDYERSILNYDDAGIAKHVEAAIGLLTRSVCDNDGEVADDTIAAFNAWRTDEFRRMRDEFAARHPDDWHLFWHEKEPEPVHAGRWSSEAGWQRVEPLPLAA